MSEQQTQTKTNKNKNHPRYYLDIPKLRHYDSTLLVKHLQKLKTMSRVKSKKNQSLCFKDVL